MANIPADKLITWFRTMWTEKWKYRLGAAVKGTVDCSGAFVYAYRQHGKSIAHGSNSIARNYVTELKPISQVQPGMAVFKSRAPGASGYNLPVKYQPGGKAYNGDLNDYYHIGLADADPAWALNAQSTETGFVRSKIRNGWTACGYLKDVDYGKEDNGMYKTGMQPTTATDLGTSPSVLAGTSSGAFAPPSPEGEGQTIGATRIVTAANGKTVNFRTQPNGKVIAPLAVGTRVTELERTTDSAGTSWTRIRCEGWMMSKFLEVE